MTDFNGEILPNKLGNSSYFKFHTIVNDHDNKLKKVLQHTVYLPN